MDRETFLTMQDDPALFRDNLLVPSAFGPAKLGPILADFQRRDFAILDAAVLALARGECPPTRRIWLERTKGASKDSDAAVSLLWLLMFATRPVRCRIGAADQQQADEVRQIVQQILRLESPLNMYLAGFVDVQGARIINKQNGSVADILTADRWGSHGSRPDFTLINELSHINDQQFAETLFDDADKVRTSVVLVCTNAGFDPSWQLQWHELARTSDRWHFSAFTEPAPWIDPADLEESKRRNSAARFNRLWRGLWVRNEGDAIDEADIEAAITLAGATYSPAGEFIWVGGLDLSTKRDHSAFVVLAADWINHRVRLACCRSWKPGPSGVDLQQVRREVGELARRFDCAIAYDPHQCHLLAADLRADGVVCVETPFTGPNLNRMASCLIQTFKERRIDLYRDAELIADLGRLCIVEKQFGYKLEASHDPNAGHADRAFALAIALPPVVEISQTYAPEPEAFAVGGVVSMDGQSSIWR